MAGEALDNSAHLQIPDNHLGILASRCDKSITLANVDICDKVKVAMETCLQAQGITVPHFDDPEHIQTDEC